MKISKFLILGTDSPLHNTHHPCLLNAKKDVFPLIAAILN